MFEEFVRDEDIPAYAILSHTWGNDEVTYKDMNKNRALAESKPGYRKIEFCAKRIRDDGIEHFWVDSCCINKSSSAELSEAINSMYRWYRNAAVCYTFLSDVPTRLDGAAPEADEAWWKKFRDARWFSRGWCLQELIAPQRLVFFSENGIHLGTKKSMAVELQAITGVPISVLVTGNVSKSSVAQRMSWAAHRSTSRAEDIAYCLMGIFEVNMAMLYGEGERAFLRLQEEIIKTSDDMSLFCW
ncbi:HET-domain-containing protein, partial [Microthyrium microscopicum]